MSSNVIVSRKIAVTRVNGPSVEFCPEINKRPPPLAPVLSCGGIEPPPPLSETAEGGQQVNVN